MCRARASAKQTTSDILNLRPRVDNKCLNVVKTDWILFKFAAGPNTVTFTVACYEHQVIWHDIQLVSKSASHLSPDKKIKTLN